jgi:hypothetical protein
MADVSQETNAVFEAALEQALAERAKLDVLIASLSAHLGQQVPEGMGQGVAPISTSQQGSTADPVSSIAEGEFLGQTGTKAAAEVLRRYGSKTRPLGTDDLYRAITRGGVKIGTPGILYRSLSRNRDFLRVGRGKWGLTIWYPERAGKVKPKREDQPAVEEEPEPETQEPPDEVA